MPFLLLLLTALAGGSLIALAFERLAPARGATTAASDAVEAVVESSRFRAWWRVRTDPATVTGLALTGALVMVIGGGVVIALLAYLSRGNATLASIDSSAANWGNDHATALSTRLITWVTDLGDWPVVPLIALPILLYEWRRRPNIHMALFVLLVYAGDKLISNGIKDLVDRARPTLNPIARTLGPSFPSARIHGGGVLRRACTDPAGDLLAWENFSPAVPARSRSPSPRAACCPRTRLRCRRRPQRLGPVFALCAIAFGGWRCTSPSPRGAWRLPGPKPEARLNGAHRQRCSSRRPGEARRMNVNVAERKAESFTDTPVFEALARTGYLARGALYALIGVLAIRLANGVSGPRPNQQGALQQIEQQRFGHALLILTAIGLGGYALWRLAQAPSPHARIRRARRLDRIGASAASRPMRCSARRIEVLRGPPPTLGPDAQDDAGVPHCPLDGSSCRSACSSSALPSIRPTSGSEEVPHVPKTDQMFRVRTAFTTVGVTGCLARAVAFGLTASSAQGRATTPGDAAIDGRRAPAPALLRHGGAIVVAVRTDRVRRSYSVADARYRRI
jgi:hypothetical protein